MVAACEQQAHVGLGPVVRLQTARDERGQNQRCFAKLLDDMRFQRHRTGLARLGRLKPVLAHEPLYPQLEEVKVPLHLVPVATMGHVDGRRIDFLGVLPIPRRQSSQQPDERDSGQ